MTLHPVRKQCPYCQRETELVPPYHRQSDLEFIVACSRDPCRKRLLVLALNGRVRTVKTPRRFRLASRMLGESDFYPQVARLIEEACESAYLNSLRAAAVTLRVSAQLFVGAEVFGKDPNSPDLPRMRKMIEQLDGSHPPVAFPAGRKRTIVNSLTIVTRLGDTAAHPNVDASWRLLPLPSNIADGITAIENLIAATKGWAL